ncbi:hypothetical protein EAH89_15730 [Roseomonas nepalensis]|uniref:Nucleotidyl transferase AbiEii/AbiGii toxin family protein n=1 Tax=Muricoccus nepalensis TaxID=1854500 RepID=A0A502FVY8_9PROT|nr:hypothetical protein EAH89_15730 [Roseomonas nepalensis]
MTARDEGASTYNALLRHSRLRNLSATGVLERFVGESFISALGSSPFAARFPLHGAWCLGVWFGELTRPTWGVDLVDLERSSASEVICILRQAVGDHLAGGLHLNWYSARIATYQERRSPLQRISLQGHLGPATLPIRVNVTAARQPEPEVEFRHLGRTLSEWSRAPVATCTPDEMVAEKAALLVTYGPHHSRSKDVRDLRTLADGLPFDGASLLKTMAAVFNGRDAARMLAQEGYWEAALDPGRLDANARAGWMTVERDCGTAWPAAGLAQTMIRVRAFLQPLLAALRQDQEVAGSWQPAVGWVEPQTKSTASQVHRPAPLFPDALAAAGSGRAPP